MGMHTATGYERTNATNIYLSTEDVTNAKKPKPKPTFEKRQRSTAAIILAGSFGQGLVEESIEYAQRKGMREPPMNIQGTQGSERVSAATLPFGKGQFVVDSLFNALKAVRRLEVEDIFMVCNEADKVEALAWANTHEFLQENVLSNGAKIPSEERTEMADLQLAINTFDLVGCHLVVMDPASALFPGYFLQPIVEHSILLNHDVVGYTHFNATVTTASAASNDLLPYTATLLNFDHTEGPPGMPRVKELVSIDRDTFDASLHTNACVASGFTTLRKATVPQLLSSNATSVSDFLITLCATEGEKISGCDMGWGHLYMGTLSSFLYTESLMFYFERANVLQIKDVTEKLKNEFEERYFGDQTADIRAVVGHKLPTAFF